MLEENLIRKVEKVKVKVSRAFKIPQGIRNYVTKIYEKNKLKSDYYPQINARI